MHCVFGPRLRSEDRERTEESSSERGVRGRVGIGEMVIGLGVAVDGLFQLILCHVQLGQLLVELGSLSKLVAVDVKTNRVLKALGRFWSPRTQREETSGTSAETSAVN